jgi:hypothetical protein
MSNLSDKVTTIGGSILSEGQPGNLLNSIMFNPVKLFLLITLEYLGKIYFLYIPSV